MSQWSVQVTRKVSGVQDSRRADTKAPVRCGVSAGCEDPRRAAAAGPPCVECLAAAAGW